jgi:hypothetical protein
MNPVAVRRPRSAGREQRITDNERTDSEQRTADGDRSYA